MRSKTRPTKSSRYLRYKNAGPSRSLRAKWLNPLSSKQLVRFAYADSGYSRTLNVAGNYTAYYVFRGNSVFDPDVTGVGVQPYGYDDLCTDSMYTNYRVTSSSISVYFRPESTYANMRRLHAMIIPMVSSTPVLTDISDVRNIPYHKETTYDGVTESTKGAKMKHYHSTKRAVPIYNPNDFDFSAAYTANPLLAWHWIVFFYAEEFDDEEVDIYFDVKIKYYTILTRYGVPNES